MKYNKLYVIKSKMASCKTAVIVKFILNVQVYCEKKKLEDCRLNHSHIGYL